VVENEAEHAKAVQEALAVRGVKQLIDQIQVLPAAPLSPGAPSTASGGPAQAPPAINATISIGGSAGAGSTGAGKGQAGNAQKPVAASKADSQKHGFFHLPKRNSQTSTTGAQKQTDTSKTADSQKQGFFHFLKKNKDKNKKDTTKNDSGH
jgi:predicted RecA/RadA family phage recombinase